MLKLRVRIKMKMKPVKQGIRLRKIESERASEWGREKRLKVTRTEVKEPEKIVIQKTSSKILIFVFHFNGEFFLLRLFFPFLFL